MKLNIHQWGAGQKTAILIHGLFADHQSWWRVGPALATRGYRVLAPDLRGHGLSPRGPYSPHHWAADLVDSLPRDADLAIGHSLGGLSLVLAAAALQVQSAIYVDPAWKLIPEQELAFKAAWAPELDWTTEQWLEAHPFWAAGDITARLSSVKNFDPACIDGLLTGNGYDHIPRAITCPSLALLAHPSEFVPHNDATHLQDIGMEVWALPHTTHSMHREDYDLFMLAIDRWRTQP
jgi:pimeloyl-ACP methyl ester carboxylesterase